jgi:murein DD-endopeptidase MepM/ murein hydrolase activator NlpD
VPHRNAGRHRRRRKSLVSPSALAGVALSASVVAGVTLGTAAATTGDANRLSGTSAASKAASAAAAAHSGTAAATDSGIEANATSPSAASDSDDMPAPAGPVYVAGNAETGVDLAPGKVVPTRPAMGGAPSADAARRKARALPELTVTTRKPGGAWVNPNPTAVVTSCFGQRWGRLHAGVDLAAPDGTPIVAAGAGVVVRAGVAEGYGNAVLIDHGNGFLTHYGHLSKITVTVGQHVAAGQQIGNEGSTGHSTGPHLHFEVHQGYYQNPIEPTGWMHRHGVDIPGCVPLTQGVSGS